MTLNVEKFAGYQGEDEHTSRATHFEQTGIVLNRLAIDDYDGVAVVELEASHSLWNDNLAG
jgi:hypothetical protein